MNSKVIEPLFVQLVHPLEMLAQMVAPSECFVAIILVAKGAFDLFGLVMSLHMTVQGIEACEGDAAETCERPVFLPLGVFVELCT